MSELPCTASTDPLLVGDPVNIATGAAVDDAIDFRLAGPIEFRWVRHYDSSQSHRCFAHGWGHTHDFDRSLRFDADGVSYHAPLDRIVRFTPIPRENEEIARDGYVLRRVSKLRFQLHHHGEPSMEFEFRSESQPARLSRLFQGRHQIVFVCAADGRWERIVDSLGRTIRVVEQPNGRLVSLTLESQPGQPGTLLAVYTYDKQGNLIATRDASGCGFSCTYGTGNRMVCRTGRKGFNFRFVYDAQGRCVHSSGDGGRHEVRLEYTVPELVTKVRRADGGLWTYFFEGGALSKVIDPLGGLEELVRDETGRLTSELDPNRNATHYVYDHAGAAVAKVTCTGHAVALPERPNAPDHRAHQVAANPAEYEFGRLLDVEKISLPSVEQAASIPMPPEARARLSTRPNGLPNTPERSFQPEPLGPRWWPEPKRGWVFNDFGQLVSQEDDWGRTRHWSYDPSGNVCEFTDFDGRQWSYDLASWHLRLAETNPLGATERFAYNSAARIVAFTDPGGTVSEYAYDLKDQLVEVRRHGVVRDRYTRDAAGNLIAKHAADGRLMLELKIGPGNLPVKRTLASGDEHTFRYDKAGRPLQADTRKDSVEFAYDGFGNAVVEMRNGLGVTQRFQGGCKPAQSVCFGRFAVRYEWRGERTLVITDPGGKSHEIRFHSNGLVERRFSNGTTETCQYDGLGRCLLKYAQRRNGHIWSRRYHWSGEGELQRVEDNVRGEARHEYDAAHRLRRRSIAGRVDNYEMDLAGNLTQQPGLSHVTLQSGNRLDTVNGQAVSYNDRNHIETRALPSGAVRYLYDSRDQLVGVQGLSAPWHAEYDAFNRRTRKTWAGKTTEYYWNGDQLIAEIEADGRLRLYIYADPLALTPLLILDYDSLKAPLDSCRRYFVFSDQIGAPTLIEDERAAEVWLASVSPFGRVEVEPGAKIQCQLRFPGQYFDPELGLHYNRFRYYDPVLGRYLQSDPWGITGGHNLYAYRSNPLLLADVRGLGEEGDEDCKPKPDEESNQRQSIAQRQAEGGNPPPYALANPELYEYDPESGQYRRIEGEGHSRSSEFPSGYRQSTHDEMAAAHTDEGRAQGGVPVDEHGNPIPHDQLTWRDANGNVIPYHDDEGNTNLTYDHKTSCVDMHNNGATVTDPNTGQTTTYPPGNNTDRATRNDFYNDPNNLQPMSRSDNSSKGGGGQTYNDQPTGPDYKR
jgi:RHS repeat-associated protein